MIEASIFSGTVHSFRYDYYYLFILVSRFLIRKKEKSVAAFARSKVCLETSIMHLRVQSVYFNLGKSSFGKILLQFFCKEGRFGDAECSKQSQRVIQLCINVSPLSSCSSTPRPMQKTLLEISRL